MDGGAWWATVCGVAKNQTRLSDFTFPFTFWQVQKTPKRLVDKNFSEILPDSAPDYWTVYEDFYKESYLVKVLVAQSCPLLWDPWTVAHQAPLSMEFSRQEYWSEL